MHKKYARWEVSWRDDCFYRNDDLRLISHRTHPIRYLLIKKASIGKSRTIYMQTAKIWHRLHVPRVPGYVEIYLRTYLLYPLRYDSLTWVTITVVRKDCTLCKVAIAKQQQTFMATHQGNGKATSQSSHGTGWAIRSKCYMKWKHSSAGWTKSCNRNTALNWSTAKLLVKTLERLCKCTWTSS